MDPYDPGELLAASSRAVLEVMLHKAAHALAVVRSVQDPSAEGNRNHNKRFAALATQIGPAGPERPEKVVGWSDCPTSGRHNRNVSSRVPISAPGISCRSRVPCGGS
jgi:hypothetical protein